MMCGAVVAIIPLLSIGPRETHAGDNLPNNIVYVESNDPNGNAIFAFKRGLDGSLTPIARLAVRRQGPRNHADVRARAV